MHRMIPIAAYALMLAATPWVGPARADNGPMPAASDDPTQARRFSVKVVGQGPDVILVPGLLSSRDVWDGVVARLKSDYRLHLVQLAGFAGEPVASDPGGLVVEPVVEGLAGYIRDQELQHPAVVGHSMGGAIALLLAARHPNAVGRLVVVDTLPFFGLVSGPNATADAARPAAAAMRSRMIDAAPRCLGSGYDATAARLVQNEQGRKAIIRWASASDCRTIAEATYEIMTTDLRPELPKITAPLDVFYAYDPALSMPAAQLDALYRNAYANAKTMRLTRVDDARHFIMLDQPERFLAALTAALCDSSPPN